jgi:hypothetical protein
MTRGWWPREIRSSQQCDTRGLGPSNRDQPARHCFDKTARLGTATSTPPRRVTRFVSQRGPGQRSSTPASISGGLQAGGYRSPTEPDSSRGGPFETDDARTPHRHHPRPLDRWAYLDSLPAIGTSQLDALRPPATGMRALTARRAAA